MFCSIFASVFCKPEQRKCFRVGYTIYCLLKKIDIHGKRSSICIAHRREHAHASNALSSLTRAACRTATVCSLQTQAGAAAS